MSATETPPVHVEAEVTLAEDVPVYVRETEISGIRDQEINPHEKDEDVEQLVYLLENLNPRQRRETLLRVKPMFEPMLCSTKLETEESSASEKDGRVTPTVLKTASGNVTLEHGTSKVIIQASSDFSCKLKTFSGIKPVPAGQVDFRTWFKAAQRLRSDSERQTSELLGRIQNSLCNPALEIAQSALDSGCVDKVLQLLNNVYGDADDPQDLLNKFHAMVMTSEEKASDYLNRLYLFLGELRHRGIVKCDVADSVLLKQFVYGCADEHLILKLRLDEDGRKIPDFGTLLFAIRQEETKRSRRQHSINKVGVKQVAASDGACELEALRKEVASLKSQLNTATMNRTSIITKRPQSTSQARQRKLRFCFKCGADGHTVWTCKNNANPELVSNKFEEAKRLKQENQ